MDSILVHELNTIKVRPHLSGAGRRGTGRFYPKNVTNYILYERPHLSVAARDGTAWRGEKRERNVHAPTPTRFLRAVPARSKTWRQTTTGRTCIQTYS